MLTTTRDQPDEMPKIALPISAPEHVSGICEREVHWLKAMRYPYHDASDHDFEALAIELCVYLLGDGVQSFSTGPDGGRDARFHGTAQRFPSPRDPYSGEFVIQAKHTEHPYAKFSDTDFSGQTKSSILQKEIPRIRRLVKSREIDHYLLFSNRRLAGEADRRIRKHLRDQTGVSSVELFGVERIDDTIKRFPDTMDRAGLSELKAPLRVTPDDLAEVICALEAHKESFEEAAEEEIHRTSFEEKNRLNRVRPGFVKEITRSYLPNFGDVKAFLAHPDNEEIQERYLDAVAEFREQIVIHRSDEHSMEAILLNLQRLLWQRDGDLARRKRLTKLVLYYMYWVCDLGDEPEA